MKIMYILSLMRIYQYVKNLFIFLPVFFALKITENIPLLNAIIAFVAFSLCASAVYIFNDYRDIKEDKAHPKKKNRPLASGKISKKESIVIIAFLLTFGLLIICQISIFSACIILGYVIMNVAYSLYLKHIAIIDVIIIALGFVIRIFVGSVVTNIALSKWIIIMTFLIALFLALAKRRDDVLIYLNTGKKMRKVIDGYNLQFLDIAMSIMASVVIVSYILYTTSEEVVRKFNCEDIYLTVLFVILGVMRYLQISFVKLDSGSPTHVILKDPFIQITILAWAVSFIWILKYGCY